MKQKLLTDAFFSNNRFCISFWFSIYLTSAVGLLLVLSGCSGSSPFVRTGAGPDVSEPVVKPPVTERTQCGNAVRDDEEECDGSDLNHKGCTDFGFDDGTLTCDDRCEFDTSGCLSYECNDGDTQNCGSDVGECQPGTITCSGGHWGSCQGAVGPGVEICDGLDNDCDGQVDGQTRSCGINTGQCESGIRTCQNGNWGSCEGYVGPVAEICEGSIDENCNGQTDEGCDCKNGDMQSCGLDVGECESGIKVCSSGQWSWCIGDVGPSVETCDGLDNDCDGQVDGLTRSCGIDTGQCESGTETCQSGNWGSCEGSVGPGTEICEGSIDENCNGQTDEGCHCIDGETQSCDSDVGECESGIRSCSSGQWGDCQGAVGPGTEICDGLDNDCDGQVDGLTRSCGIDTGQCESGTETCQSGDWGSCQGAVAPVAEICDGLDNDCDGQVDGLTRSCGIDTGQCESGTETCQSGNWGSCEGFVGPGAEICDGLLDEDCDGQTDEGCDCGDGEISSEEECDEDDLNDQACEDFGFAGGDLNCDDNCEFDTLGCFVKDEFLPEPNHPVDVLWVIDDSGSMEEDQQQIHDNAHFFMQELLKINSEFQLAVISNDALDRSKMKSLCKDQSGAPLNGNGIITLETADRFAACVQVGTGGSGLEEGIEAARRALDPTFDCPNSGQPCNPEFLRDEADLQIVFVSDEEDQPHPFVGNTYGEETVTQALIDRLHDPTWWGETIDDGRPPWWGGEAYFPLLDRPSEPEKMSHRRFFEELKPGKDVRMHAITLQASNASCSELGEVSLRYPWMANRFGGTVSDLCGDWSETLEAIRLEIAGRNQCQKLTTLPMGGASGVVEVTINGTPTGNWSYESASNSVCLEGNPEFQDLIIITYYPEL